VQNSRIIPTSQIQFQSPGMYVELNELIAYNSYLSANFHCPN